MRRLTFLLPPALPLRLAVLMLGLAAAPWVAMAAETELLLDRGLAATLSMPDGNGPFPAVLMLHGLGSSRDEVGGIFSDSARVLAENGIASLRFDFRGFGKSAGDTGAFTLERQNMDAQIALQALATTARVDPHRLGVTGFSFGGAAAIELAAARPDLVRSVVALTPAGDYRADMLDSMGQRVFDRARQDGIAGIDFGWRTMALKQGFFDSLARHDPIAALARYQGPVTIINGEDDPYRKYAVRMIEAAAGRDRRAVVMQGSDHVFHVYKPSQSRVLDVIDLMVARFRETL
jgi:pimeloyl-ACP methyl ester carboxylesterase